MRLPLRGTIYHTNQHNILCLGGVGLHIDVQPAPSLPPNVTVIVGTIDQGAQGAGESEVDPELRRRIEELAARDDRQGEEGQRQLRGWISDAVRSVGPKSPERDVRRRIE